MSVLIFIDHIDGHVKKASLEALSYGAKIAEQTGDVAEGIVLGSPTEDLAALGQYGVKKIHQVQNDGLTNFDAQTYTKVIAQAAQQIGAKLIVFSNNSSGKSIAPRLAVRLKAGLVSGAVALPDISNGFIVKKNVFSGKAFANVAVNTPVKIISLNPNSYSVTTTDGVAEVAPFSATIDTPKVQVTDTNKV